MAEPYSTCAPVGAVMELGAGVPANWIVLVVGVIVDWAFAEKVASAMKTARQNKTAANFPRKTDLLGANVTAVIEDPTFAFLVSTTLAIETLSFGYSKKASSKN